MDQTTEAKMLRFERIHSGDRSSDQWRLMTRLPGLDIDVHSLPSTTPLLLDIDRIPAINRCRDEVIDRLSDIMTECFSTFRATRFWTAWRLYSVGGLDSDRDAQVDTAKVIITRSRIIPVERRAQQSSKRRSFFGGSWGSR